MHRKIVLIMTVSLFLTINASILFTFDSQARVLHVGGAGEGNYTSIQQAIYNASAGDTIYVHSGVYNENIFISSSTHSIRLIGENREETVINSTDESIAAIEILGENCTVENFTIINAGEKATSVISISYTSNVKLINNTIIGANHTGLYMFFSTNVTLIGNSIKGGGINIIGSSLENWNTHNITNNTLNGKVLYYLKDLSGFTLSSKEAGQIIMVNCTNCRIKDMEVSGSDYGIIIAFSSYNVIEDCHFHDNRYGIFIHKSKDNTIQDNTVENNRYGIFVTHSSYNEIKDNLIKSNQIYGCSLCCGSFYNTLYLNNFTMNGLNARDTSIFNKWYHKKIGNYWSDYNGTDSNQDGIGDIPYVISVNENKTVEDKYPIVSFEKVKSLNQTPDNNISLSILAIFLSIVILRKLESRVKT